MSRVGDRADTLISPEQQQGKIEAYARMNDLQVEMLPPELDVSGGRASRPILDSGLARIQSGEVAGIIVAQLDRLSRMDIVEALKTIRAIEAAGGEVRAVAEDFDVDTPEGEAGRNLFLVMGEMQLGRYKQQFRAAKAQAVEKGIWPIPVVPRGYVKGDDRHLHPGEDREVPRRAMEMRANDASWGKIAAEFGIGLTSAMKMVRNRVYLGEIHYGEWVNLEAHEALVPRDLYEAAQIYHPPPPRSRRSKPALLAGLVYCAGCGYRMSVDSHAGIFKCRPHKASGRCPAPAIISQRKLERLVSQAVRADMEQQIELRYEAVERGDATAAAERELQAAEAELAAYQTLVKISDVGAEHFANGMRQRVAAVEAARRKLAKARLAAPALPGGSLADLTEGQWRQGLRSAIGGVWVWKAGGRGQGSRFRIVASGFEPVGFRSLPWSDGDLPGEIRPLSP